MNPISNKDIYNNSVIINLSTYRYIFSIDSDIYPHFLHTHNNHVLCTTDVKKGKCIHKKKKSKSAAHL